MNILGKAFISEEEQLLYFNTEVDDTPGGWAIIFERMRI